MDAGKEAIAKGRPLIAGFDQQIQTEPVGGLGLRQSASDSTRGDAVVPMAGELLDAHSRAGAHFCWNPGVELVSFEFQDAAIG